MTEKSGCYIKGEVFYRGWCYSLMNGSPQHPQIRNHFKTKEKPEDY
ncbi:Hypothetical protein ACI5QL_00473 [Bacillus velezensis]|uniref:Uncharacterized protein n=1 Tax=Bacillus amyloliquefaciens (strain Y2) TaxID=1155777 RepID=I2C1I1_BACAY|nr:hypothetical protein MUS_0428 [Bacillus velezensis YAU B9601-Y2]RUS03366.1 hypothetical protein EFW58_03821 [Bacillus velezensis]